MNTARPASLRPGLAALAVFALTARTFALDVAGITEPTGDATLTTPVAGIVSKIQFREGDSVPEGAVVVQLDSTIARVELDPEVAAKGVIFTDLATAAREHRALFEK